MSLERFHANTSQLHSPGVALTTEQFTALRDLLAEFSGVYLDATRQRQLELGLECRLRATKSDPATYVRALREKTSVELHRLAELVLNHETVFFRNQPHMNALRDIILPDLVRRKPTGLPIRIWSAGCATGEEAYSLALLALDTPGCTASVWATDLSEAALQAAREGVYRGRTLQNVPAHLFTRYFQPFGDAYRIGPEVRALVHFETLNLLDRWPARAQCIDILFCQNVTIYFTPETSRRVLENFFSCLDDDGLLFLGFSENLWNVFDGFQTRSIGGAYVYAKAPRLVPAEKVLRIVSQPEAPQAAHVVMNTQPATKRRRSSVSNERVQVFHDQKDRKQETETVLQAAAELVEQGHFEHAIDLLGEISPHVSQNAQIHVLLAKVQAARDNLDMAIAEAQAAIELEPLQEEAHILLGTLASHKQEWNAAVGHFERARYLNHESAIISFHLAEAYRQTSQRSKAEQEYRNTLRKLSKHPPDAVLEGVAVGWLRDICQRQLAYFQRPT